MNKYKLIDMNSLNKYYRYILITCLSIGLPLIALAQETVSKSPPTALNWILDNLLLLSIGAVLLVLAIAFSNTHNKMINLQLKQLMIERGDYVEPVKVETTPFWEKIYDKAWALVPLEKEQDIDLGHEYDGIRELDNSLPPWWVYLWYATIIWGAAYVYVSHYSDYDIGLSQADEYLAEVASFEIQQRKYLAAQKNRVDESNVTALMGEADIAAGEGIYNLNCVTCHGMKGEGGIGPNMTDPNWIHGGGIKNIFKLIKYGAPDMGMIAWKSQLPPLAIQQVASYILTMEGTNPPNAKAPQGEIYVEEAEETDDELSMNTTQ